MVNQIPGIHYFSDILKDRSYNMYAKKEDYYYGLKLGKGQSRGIELWQPTKHRFLTWDTFNRIGPSFLTRSSV